MASPSFLYLSDDPQAYLLLLKDFIRPCPDICHNCKVRCCDNFIKTASAPDLAWNRISPDERLRPAHTFLDVQLSDLGIDSTNKYGLDLSDEEIDKVFQPAVRRLTLDSNWYTLVDAFAAMTCYRGMGRPDRAHDQYDQYKLGKKIIWMACPRFTAYELARPRLNGDIMAKWLWNLAQLLSDGADVYLSSPSFPKTEDEYLSRPSSEGDDKGVAKPADTTTCTCPLFSVLNGRHPDTFTGYEWINLVLRTAESRIEPSLLEAWSQPLTPDELLSSSTPYRPLCPGYDCRTDRTWQEDFVHKRNNVIGSSELQTAAFESDVDLIRLLGDAPIPIDGSHPDENQQARDFDPTRDGGGPFNYSLIDTLSSPWPPPSSYHDSLIPGFSIPTGTSFNSDSQSESNSPGPLFLPAFKFVYRHTDLTLSVRCSHYFRQILLKAYLARTFRYSPGCDTGEDKIPDLFLRAVFSSEPLPPHPHPPMKSLFSLALRLSHTHRSSILSIPLDLNPPTNTTHTNRPIRSFIMPRLQRKPGAHLPNGFDFRPSSQAKGWRIHYGTLNYESGAADYEDVCLFWGCRHLMRGVFEWEGRGEGEGRRRLGWEGGGEPR